VSPEAYCESMCVFLLLSGKSRYVPEQAHVRVHQIWMGDRADNARAASYSADDVMTVERDIGRLAKYTFDMGGAGDLLSLSLSLNVPPWEDLHELSREELRLTNLLTTDMVAQSGNPNAAVVEPTPKPVRDRFTSGAVEIATESRAGENHEERPKLWADDVKVPGAPRDRVRRPYRCVGWNNAPAATAE
jgi:hypothetical protein